ncbi:MAG: prepilin-type N-terminal cleavage/methylation domain-containing protein [Desulfuromonadales bacterium]|nr:prepilin-type N-terminal cleavage/methylation domain-containing protein [Desulfuromonadales bacterium]
MLLSRRRQLGFSLVEVMVSLAIFLIASMGLVPLLLTGMRTGQRNALHGEARRLAGEAMTALQVADYGALPAFDGRPFGDGAIQVVNTVEDDLPESGQTRLTVTASWLSAGQTHRYQLQTIRSRP